MKDANALYHSWMKRFGNGAGFFQKEMVRDMNGLLGLRISENNKFWLKEMARLTEQIYRLEKELKMITKKSLCALIALFMVSTLYSPASAWNLWTDVQQNTEWTLGSNAAAGTAVALKNSDALGIRAGQYVPSFLAQITQYRFLSAWWGGNEIKQPDGSQKIFDTAKIGFNVAYIFTGFVNQPPDLIKRLVVGPSLTMSFFSTPHVVVPFLDVNYQFGTIATNTQPVPMSAAPSVPPSSKLNLFYGPIAG